MPPFGYLVTFNYNGTSYVDVTKFTEGIRKMLFTITSAGETVNFGNAQKLNLLSGQICEFNYELELVTPRPRHK